MEKLSGISAGVSGEYFVAAELSRRGYISSVTLKNTKGIDILVSNENGSKLIGIQVKTNQGSRKAWVLSAKAEDVREDLLIYVLVNLNGLGVPDYYIVSSKTVADEIKSGHSAWLNTPGKKGQKHNDNNMRLFGDLNDTHKEKWDVIEAALT